MNMEERNMKPGWYKPDMAEKKPVDKTADTKKDSTEKKSSWHISDEKDAKDFEVEL
jgi:hypothetical protein